MLTADRVSGPGRFTLKWAVGLVAVPCLALLAAGCSQCPPSEMKSMGPMADPGRLQVQFYSPPGAIVTVRGCAPGSRTIVEPGAFGNRLESTPEEFAVYNLENGRCYAFKYTAAEGLPGVSIYGELEVHYANTEEGRKFQRLAFIPLALPSEYYRQIEVLGDEIVPYRSERYRTAIDDLDLLRLRHGDVVEKAFFVADLKEIHKQRKELERELAVKERDLEYSESRFRTAYWAFQLSEDSDLGVLEPGVDTKRFFEDLGFGYSSDREFIGWEDDRRELDQEIEELREELERRRALLKGDNVVIRRGMLAVATEEIVEPYEDPAHSIKDDDLGDLLLVMRLGGRHLHWGDEETELAAIDE